MTRQAPLRDAPSAARVRAGSPSPWRPFARGPVEPVTATPAGEGSTPRVRRRAMSPISRAAGRPEQPARRSAVTAARSGAAGRPPPTRACLISDSSCSGSGWGRPATSSWAGAGGRGWDVPWAPGSRW